MDTELKDYLVLRPVDGSCVGNKMLSPGDIVALSPETAAVYIAGGVVEDTDVPSCSNGQCFTEFTEGDND